MLVSFIKEMYQLLYTEPAHVGLFNMNHEMVYYLPLTVSYEFDITYKIMSASRLI